MRNSPQRTPIAQARLAAGVQQKELAAKLGCTVHHLQKVELGKRQSPSLERKALEALRK